MPPSCFPLLGKEKMNWVVRVSHPCFTSSGFTFSQTPVSSTFKRKKEPQTSSPVAVTPLLLGTENCLWVSDVLVNLAASWLPRRPLELAEISDVKNQSSYLVSGVSSGCKDGLKGWWKKSLGLSSSDLPSNPEVGHQKAVFCLFGKVSWDAGPQDLGGAASQAGDLMGQAADPTEAIGALPALFRCPKEQDLCGSQKGVPA